MHIEQIDRYCDLFEERLKQGESLTADQFLQEQRIPAERQLQAELEKLEREYRQEPAGVRQAVVLNDLARGRSRPALRTSPSLQARPGMPTSSIDELEQAILRAGILSQQELGEALAQLPPDTREAGPETVAQEFVRRGRLTEFQKQMLLAGQSDGLVLGEYTLLSLLGAGGMGRVFRALHRRMGREVALKVLPERLVAQEDAVQRFEREVRVAARLVHPNVVTAYDAGEHQGMHYLVMEYVPGADLASVVRSLGPLPVADALRCTIQAAAGLAYAHAQGVTHRDIKPSNLLLDPHGAVKVLDLGLARMRAVLPGQSDSLSASGAVMGTVDFMPPEQALNAKSADERSDVYSLGCTLYFLLTGKPVYERDSIMEKLLAHREAPIPSLREQLPDVAPQLDAVITRMLAKNPVDRFATMTEGGDALRQCLVATGGENDLAVRAAGRLGSVGVKAASAQETRDFMVERSLMSTRIAAPPTYVPPGSQVSVASAPSPSRRRTWLVGGLAALLLVAAGVVVYLQFADGTLRVQVIAQDAEVLVDENQVATVTWADRQKEYRISLDPGRHRIKVRTKDGDVFYSNDEVIVKAGRDTKLFRAEWIRPSSPAPQPPVVSGAEAIKDGILTVARDGSAEFTSMQSALDAVQKPGMTIRVLDAAEYAESVELQVPRRFSKLTLESTNRATLIPPAGRGAVSVRSVDGVTVRGFRIRIEQPASFGMVVEGHCPGCVVEDVEFFGSMFGARGLGLEALSVPPGANPVIVRKCRFESQYIGLRISGLMSDYKTPMPCRGALIAGNSFLNSTAGLSIIGAVSDVAVVGNRFNKCNMAGVQFENLVDDAGGNPPRGLLLANCTFLECAASLKLWDDQVRRDAVTVRSNLVLDPAGVDWAFIDSGDDPTTPRGPGKGQQVIDTWRVGGNWRETAPPPGTTVFEQAWIPPAATDVLKVPIEVPRDPDMPDFLQPAAESELATAGSGEEHGLPPYVGAVPPPGAQEWDWNKTWQAWTGPAADGVLTVAQDGSAEFTSLKAAIDAVMKPGTTIRVLDEAEYVEPLLLQVSRRYAGLTLESTRRATLRSSPDGPAVHVKGVDGVTIRGFRVGFDERQRSSELTSFAIGLERNCSGCVLEDLEFLGWTAKTVGIILQDMSTPPTSNPAIVRDCRFDSLHLGVWVHGLNIVDYTTRFPCRGALIADNTFVDCNGGVFLIGAVRDVAVVGNRMINCTMAGVHFENLVDDADGIAPRGLLVANNTFLDCAASLKLWDDQVRPDAVTVRSNLVLSPVGVDWQFVDSGDQLEAPRGPGPRGPGDGRQVIEKWRVAGNWRETAPPQGTSLNDLSWIPNAETDVLRVPIEVPRDSGKPDFLQPVADSELATAGTGEAEGLPPYVGAVPPPGAKKWDWNKAWSAWAQAEPSPAESGR